MNPIAFLLFNDPDFPSATFGDEPRVYPFGEAPQDVAEPYAVFTDASGNPMNHLADKPKVDSQLVQLDVYAREPSDAQNSGKALQSFFENNERFNGISTVVTSFRPAVRDKDTKAYRYSFDVSLTVERAALEQHANV